jgi:hypothetical protein
MNAPYYILVPSLQGKPFGIAHGSAIVAQTTTEDTVVLHYEGNTNGACNLDKYEEKILCAAGRKATNYPTIAKMALKEEICRDNFEIVALFDYEACRARLKLRTITFDSDVECVQAALDFTVASPGAPAAFEAWTGKPISSVAGYAFPEEEKPEVLPVHSILVAGPLPIKLLNVLEELQSEGKIQAVLARRAYDEDRRALPDPQPERYTNLRTQARNALFWSQPTHAFEIAEKRREDARQKAEDAFLEATKGENVVDVDGWTTVSDGKTFQFSRTYYTQDPNDHEMPSEQKSFEFRA